MKLFYKPVLALCMSLALSSAFAENVNPPDESWAGPAKLQVAEKAPFGKFLTDGRGISLYMFAGDNIGRSSCYGSCAATWPPFISLHGAHILTGPGIEASKIGTIRRSGGAMQVTYNGMPLYFYIRDKRAGDVTGHGILESGAKWYLVSPAGNIVSDVPPRTP